MVNRKMANCIKVNSFCAIAVKVLFRIEMNQLY